jgi:hypothetical protein
VASRSSVLAYVPRSIPYSPVVEYTMEPQIGVRLNINWWKLPHYPRLVLILTRGEKELLLSAGFVPGLEKYTQGVYR